MATSQAATTNSNHDATRDMLIDWLRDAHAMEQQAEKVLSNTAARIENYPDLKARLESHLDETRRQAELLRGCLERLSGGRSVVKDTAAQVVGIAQAMSGLFTSDEVVKASMGSYVFEEMEIAAYKTLIITAELCGDLETKRVCEQILGEEERMAQWLEAQLPTITRQYLARVERGVTAKH